MGIEWKVYGVTGTTSKGRNPKKYPNPCSGTCPGKPKRNVRQAPPQGAAAGTNLWKSEGDAAKRPSINSVTNGVNTGFKSIYGNYGNYGREKRGSF